MSRIINLNDPQIALAKLEGVLAELLSLGLAKRTWNNQTQTQGYMISNLGRRYAGGKNPCLADCLRKLDANRPLPQAPDPEGGER